jgi:hypothetical protein
VVLCFVFGEKGGDVDVALLELLPLPALSTVTSTERSAHERVERGRCAERSTREGGERSSQRVKCVCKKESERARGGEVDQESCRPTGRLLELLPLFALSTVTSTERSAHEKEWREEGVRRGARERVGRGARERVVDLGMARDALISDGETATASGYGSYGHDMS